MGGAVVAVHWRRGGGGACPVDIEEGTGTPPCVTVWVVEGRVFSAGDMRNRWTGSWISGGVGGVDVPDYSCWAGTSLGAASFFCLGGHPWGQITPARGYDR